MSKTSKFKESKQKEKKTEIVFEDEEEENIEIKVKQPKKEFKFTLKNIDKIEIDKKYVPKELLYPKELLDETEDVNSLTSKIERLKLSTLSTHPHDKLKTKGIMNSNIYIIMKDISSKCNLPKKTNICCWNDTEPFNTEPLGMPIKYYPSTVVIKSGEYISFQPLSKLERIRYEEKINEQKKNEKEMKSKLKILNEKLKKVNGENKEKIKLEIHSVSRQMSLYQNQELKINEYYDTVGIFCSYGCMLCYFYKNKNEPLYKNSLVLIRQMIKDKCKLEGKEIPTRRIYASDDTRLLKKFGGTLSIEEYRDISKHVDHPSVLFFNMNQVKIYERKEEKKSLQNPVGLIFEQVEKL
jgi:hypothetical protein